jgi:hypothetical protein
MSAIRYHVSKELQQVITIASFIGTGATMDQIDTLSAMVNQLSIADKEWLYNSNVDMPSEVYTDLSMRNGEMGGFHNW